MTVYTPFKLCCILSGIVLLYVCATSSNHNVLILLPVVIPSSSLSSKKKTAFLLLQDFRMCRIRPEPVIGEPWVEMATMARHGLPPVDYQCSGKPYHQFAGLLEDLILTESSSSLSLWGKRDTLVPLSNNNSTTNNGRTILFMGNSHTRQTVQALLCQYQDQIVSYQTLSEPGAFVVEMQHNLTIYAACNSPFVASKSWYKTLEQRIVKRPLATGVDAIVLGHFNTAQESVKTNYGQMMMQQHYNNNTGANFPKAPTMDTVAAMYTGPVIWVGMYAQRNLPFHQQAVDYTLRNHHLSRSNLRAVYARRYIDKLIAAQLHEHEQANNKKKLAVEECSIDGRTAVGTCDTDPTGTRFRDGHRCTGSRGGHPDLIAWDVVEALHNVLS
ncbi:expressed unknown protein [Seminavis robusta]|uniref:Uncharacterized protein n=1 Tax=Seminavis robusta TaxID=568900 RepID=A0A9N8EFL4_9STRA|nr:expressed unknown protein [Seminavis robusta]|eukprot:Sro920_g220180.1 n/a (385) ;mRNA; r:6467-7621